jgi:Flp pilus assembly protein TadG
MSALRNARREGGQMIVLFTICLVVIIAMTGLVIDGGDTFLQRRDLQNIADTAAMAGAYSYTMTGQTDEAILKATDNAVTNGIYTGDTTGANVAVSVFASGGGGTALTVNVTRPHRNSFAGVIGFARWNVSATATALTGAPNASYGVMPVIFNQKTFAQFGFGPDTERGFDEPGGGPQDVPQTASSFNWTVFCTANGNACNGNSSTVADLIAGHGSTLKITLGDDIGPLNGGAHTTLFDNMTAWLNGEFPVAIVNDAGELQGFAIFHLTGSVGGSTKQLRGYFVTDNDPNFVIDPNVTGGSSAFGGYVVRLSN